MDSAMIGKISKAREYSQEPERMTFVSFSVLFNGKHQTYTVSFDHGKWSCECDFFGQRGVCSHTMAVEKVVGRSGVALEPSLTPVEA